MPSQQKATSAKKKLGLLKGNIMNQFTTTKTIIYFNFFLQNAIITNKQTQEELQVIKLGLQVISFEFIVT